MLEAIEILLSQGTVYVIIYIYLFCLALLESSQYFSLFKRETVLFSSYILLLFIGLRWETGTDWLSYKELFDSLELHWSFLINVYHFDIGYVLFNAAVKLFTENYTLFLLINSFLTIYVLYRLLIKISPYPNLSLLVFYSTFMIAQFMGSNRRMMAMVFILWSFYYLYQQQKRSYVLMLILAFLFHRSSLICLLALLVPYRAFSVSRTIVILFTSLIIGILQLPAKLVEMSGGYLSTIVNNPIVEKIVFYSETGEEHLVTSTGSLLLSTTLAIIKRSIFLLFYFYVMKKNVLDRLTQYIYNIYVFAFAGYLFFIGSFFQMLNAFFAMIEIVLIGRMYSYSSSKDKIILLILIFFYGIFQMLNALNIYPELYLPYIPFWSDIRR